MVGVSWYEAAAYADFAGKQLPTIFHWNSMALTYAAPVNVSLLLTSRSGDRRIVRILAWVAVAGYYAAALYHRWTGGY